MPTRTILTLGLTASAAVALAACATVEEAAVAATDTSYTAHLTGQQEISGGDPDGTATAKVTVSDSLEQICYDVRDIRNIGTITAAHIHRGAAGQDGPPVLTLKTANEGGFRGCDDAPQWLQEAMEAGFSGYYVNVHTTDYPKGAIRGQLGL
jgi:hypothetical protein